MGFLKSSSPAEVTEVTEVAAEPEDIEFVDEDLEAEPDEIIDDRPPGFDGPRTWEEVEENESQRVSLSISTHAVPSNDSGEAAARLAWQAAVLESDNQDPLGLGRIDGHGLRLVRQDRATTKPGGTRRNDTLLTRRGNLARRITKEAADEAVKAAVTKPFLELSGNLSDYRHKVMPTQDSFEPELYLAIMHGDTSLSDLKTGRANLKFEVSERTGQLKDLVKENFERFISCKSTIDDIHVRLRKAEGDYGDSADGASTADMVAAVTDVQQEAKRAVASMLERAGMSDRIKSVMGMLRRYESLFRLPSRIMQETECGEFEAVVSEYRKARAIMADVAVEGATEGVWHNLFLEVDKGVDMMTAKLTNSLRAAGVTVRQAADAIKHLLHLHAEGARSTKNLDPVKLYLEAQAAHVKRLFAAAHEEHAIALKCFRQQAAEQEVSDVQWEQLQATEGEPVDLDALKGSQRLTAAQARSQSASTSASTAPDSTTSAAEETLWLQFLAKMAGHIVANLPKIWQMTQEHLAPLGGISKQAQGMVSNASILATSLLKGVLDDFSERATAVLGQLSRADTKGDAFLTGVQLIATGCQRTFEVSDLPGLLPTLTKILHESGKLCVASLRSSCTSAIIAQAMREASQSLPLQASASGGFHSSLPGVMSAVLQKSLEQLKAVYTEAEQAGITSLESLSGELRAALHNCCVVFAHSTQQASGLMPKQAHEEAEEDSPSEPAEVEEQIMAAYIDSKSRQLDQVLDSFFQEDMALWPVAPPPIQLRDVCLEVLFSLIAVRAEVHLLPPPQQQEVLQSLLQHSLERFNMTLAAQLPDISTGGLLQLLLELQYLHAALAAYTSSRLEQTFVELGAMLTEHIQATQEQEQQAQAEQLNVWLSQAQGSDMME
ncbi:MAG: hypothetical protein FRX49_10424, partial [Trebouxia sp. A1-2]